MATLDIAAASEGLKESAKAAIAERQQKRETGKHPSIGISISDSPELDALGFTPMYVQDAMVEIARYLLVSNCRLVYGGDLRKDGYTYTLAALAKQYSTPFDLSRCKVTNYFAWPIHLRMSRIYKSEFKDNNIGIEELDLYPGAGVDPAVFLEWNDLPSKVIWAKSFTAMREAIVKATAARIFIGGPVSGFRSVIPGIVEEALLAMREGQPVYLCGAFGGATRAVIDAVLNGVSEPLSEAFQLRDGKFKEFYEYWNAREPDRRIDYVAICKELKNYGLSGVCRSNGLEEEENRRLFVTPHIPEMICLILKGLKNRAIIQ